MKHLSLLSILFFSVIFGTKAQSTERQDTVLLNEVVVTAAQQLTRIEGDGMVTKVHGTVLQNLGTAKDMLGYIPGVLNNNGSIEVFGRGAPVFYINGRQMKNPFELDQLKSAQIKDVKVITNPGAKYDSSANAVIRITTVKNIGEGFALDTKTVGGYRNHLYGNEQINLNYRTEGLDIFSLLHYANSKTQGTNIHTQNTWQTKHNQSDFVSKYINRQQLFDGQIGFNYTVSGHSFGAYYQSIGKYDRQSDNSDARFLIDGVISASSNIDKNDKTDGYQHLIDSYYSSKCGKWTADITFNYLWRSNYHTQDVSEITYGNVPALYAFYDQNKGRMLASEMNFSRAFWQGSFDLGASLTDSHRSDTFNNPEGIIAKSNNTTKETNLGLYMQSMQKLGPLMLQAGLRYEHIENRYLEDNVKIKDQSRDYNEFLPSVSLMVPLKTIMFQFGYSRKYSRPLYSQLSNSIHYSNEYLYETGNPSLKSTYIDVISLNFRYKWMMLMANYKHIKNRIITVSEQYGVNPEITLLKKINSPNAINSFEIMANISPGFIGNFYYPMLMGGVMAQVHNIDYRGVTKKMNIPIGIIRFNNIFRLPSNYTITSNLNWRSKGDSDNITLGQTWQLDVAVSKMLNNNWDLKLSLNDIFNTSDNSNFTMYSGIRDMHVEKIANNRSVELTIGYKFNVSKSKYKGKGAGNNEKLRFKYESN